MRINAFFKNKTFLYVNPVEKYKLFYYIFNFLG